VTAKMAVKKRVARGHTDNISADHAPLDRIDREILRRLQAEGRLSISELATEVHLSVSPCLARVRRLEERGYITGYFARLDPMRLGLTLLAIVAVRMDRTTPDTFDRFGRLMGSFDEVLECYMVGGGFDYMVKVRVKDMAAFRRFLEKKMGGVPGVQQTHTYFVIEEVKASHQMIVAN
jgi:Lrp/AsnC family transcriptional regulator, leucine-responsive regulatory protein